MERVYSSRRICSGIALLLLLLLTLFNGDTVLAAGVYNWTGQKDVGNWNGKTVYEDGWSEWSTDKDEAIKAAMYVRAAIYLPVTSWSKEYCGTSTKDKITVTEAENGYVRKEEGSYTKYNTSWSNSYTACSGYYSSTNYSSYGSGCGTCQLSNRETGYCVASGSSGMCGSAGASCGSNPSYTQKCYWITCQENVTKYNSGCNSDLSSNTNHSCGSQTTHCYYTSSSFKDVKNTSNWKKSLSEAGGYAKKVYVYSYPKRVYVEYNGNNATSICGNGDTASWNTSETKANEVNSNTNIIYKFGNPICKTEFTNKSMSSASNSNSSTYLEYYSGGTLKENEYYKIGYDFVGWNTKADGTGVSFSDKEKITAAYFQSGGKLSVYKPGETFTLYAQWKIHTYNVTFSYKCGNVQNITYQYGTGSEDLKDLDVSACNSGEDSEDNKGSIFLGWFEDTSYTSKIEKIPSTYYRDLTLYAKERQVRYFNYEQGKWIYTNDEEIARSKSE